MKKTRKPNRFKDATKALTQDLINEIQNIYAEAMECVQNSKFDETIKIVEPGIRHLKKIKACYFDDIFQMLMWVDYFKPNVSGYAIDNINLYYPYGYALIETGEIEKAEGIFRKALEINPCNIHARFELVQIFIGQKNFEAAKQELQKAYPFIYRSEDLAHFYRNYGYIFTEQELFDAAIAAYIVSFSYADDAGAETASNELGYIESIIGEEIQEPDVEQIELLAEKYNFPLGASEDVLRLAAEHYQGCIDDNSEELAEYFSDIYRDLVGDDDEEENNDKD